MTAKTNTEKLVCLFSRAFLKIGSKYRVLNIENQPFKVN